MIDYVGREGVLQIKGFVPASDCSKWRDRMLANRQNWIQRFGVKIFSYGRCWYLDIESGDVHEYYANAQRHNAAMQELGGLVEALVSSSRFLDADGRRNLPTRPRRLNLGPYWCDAGVHIGSETNENAPLHADYEGLVPYPETMFSPDTLAFSVILSVATPASGGGLMVYRKRFLADQPPPTHADPNAIANFEYSPGSLTILDSMCFHRVLPMTVDAEREFRMAAVIHFLYRAEPFPHWEHWF